MGTTAYFFVPAVRRGLARAIQGPPAAGAGRVSIPVSLALEAEKVGAGVENPAPQLQIPKVELYGPGDIVGFDERIIIRREPLPDVGDFEPNFFPFVEFADADFPWRFTPDAADATGLRPWIALIVLSEDEFEDGPKPEPGLPRSILAERARLPDPQQAWRWAHVMVTGDGTSPADAQALVAPANPDPDRMLSRLICARRLGPKTAYHAFIVPTFETGRLAGLGRSADKPTPDAAPARIALPYYARWRFATAARGDFEYLVRQLEPRQLRGLGRRPMACPASGYFDPGVTRQDDPAIPHTLGLEGALRSLDFEPTPWGMDAPPPPAPGTAAATAPAPVLGSEPARAKLAELLNMSQYDTLSAGVSGSTVDSPDPVVGPPMYGRWHAAQPLVNPSAQSWCDVINLDPRHRAAAGFGSLVVQRLQEDLMASAWKQLGAVEKANQILRAAQLAREGANALHRRLAKLPQGLFLRITGPAAARVPLVRGNVRIAATAHSAVVSSKLPAAAFDASFRRVARMRGPIRKRQFRARPTARADFFKQPDVVARLSAGALAAAPPRARPTALFTAGDITTAAFGPQRVFTPKASLASMTAISPTIAVARAPIAGSPTIGLVSTTPTQPLGGTALPQDPLAPRTTTLAPTSAPLPTTIRFREEDFSGVGLTAAIGAVRTALPAALQPWGAQLDPAVAAAKEALDWLNAPRPEPRIDARGTLDDAFRSLKGALDPAVSIAKRARSRIKGLPPARGDDLAPIMAAPEFPNPMYAPLADISQDLVLPGIDTVPQNTLALLKVNTRFVECYMVGCNHEFASELLWREYPTDQRGSYFRQFFEVADAADAPAVASAEPGAVPEQFKDIKPLHQWGRTALGTHAGRNVDLVLLVRGDLLRKYPNTLVYAVPASSGGAPNLEGFVDTPETGPGKGPVFPIASGTLAPDVSFFGFLLSQDQVRSSATSKGGYYFVLEQRLSEPHFGIDEQPGVAGPVTDWDNLAWTHFDVPPSGYLDARAPAPLASTLASQWGSSSAKMADILLQDPVRVAVHADRMLPKASQLP